VIYEYAIEPELAASWHDPRAARFFVAQMGIGTPRVPCEFPSATWVAEVMRALRASVPDPVRFQNAKKHLDALLARLRQYATQRHGAVAQNERWLDAALREHGQRAFRGILVERNPGGLPSVVLEADTFAHDCPQWRVDHAPVLRDGRQLAALLGPMLLGARELRLVDPYFDAANASFRDPILRMLATFQTAHGTGPLRAEIHTTIEHPKRHETVRPGELVLRARDKARDAITHLRAAAGPRLTLVLYVWDERHGGEKLHNRYVLTNHAGAAVQAGLDQALHRAGHTDDVTVLSPAQHAARWSQYRPASTAFREIIPPTQIAP
jgi:hypothetical protein